MAASDPAILVRPKTLLPLRQLALISVYWFGINAVWGGYEWFGQTQVELIVGRDATVVWPWASSSSSGPSWPSSSCPPWAPSATTPARVSASARATSSAVRSSTCSSSTGLALLALAEPAEWDGQALGTPALMVVYTLLFLGLQFSSNIGPGPVPGLRARPGGRATGGPRQRRGRRDAHRRQHRRGADHDGRCPVQPVGPGALPHRGPRVHAGVPDLPFVDDGPPAKPREGRSWTTIAREAWGLDVLRERSFIRMTHRALPVPHGHRHLHQRQRLVPA